MKRRAEPDKMNRRADDEPACNKISRNKMNHASADEAALQIKRPLQINLQIFFIFFFTQPRVGR